MKRRNRGYILIEATVAMVVLSLGAVTVHSVLRQGVLTRGQAQDFTTARFLMDNVMADIEMKPKLRAETAEGIFDEFDSRFSYRYSVSKVKVPFPRPVSDPSNKNNELGVPRNKSYMVRVHADVFWSRGGVPFQASREMLFGPDRYFEPYEDGE